MQLRRRIARGGWLYFAVAFIGLSAALAAVTFALLSYSSEVAREQLTSRITQAEMQAVDAMQREIEITLIDVTTDLLAFRDIAGRALDLTGDGDPRLSALSEIMLDFMQHHRSYDQLRLLAVTVMSASASTTWRAAGASRRSTHCRTNPSAVTSAKHSTCPPTRS